tara:strand:+ start:196 stop:699 length:504 start_codon:yes stop_codon:yes gene_type:complete
MRPQPTDLDSQKTGQAGFALYLAMGFIVLMSILVSNVGDRLNIATLNDARRTDTTALSLAAQGGVQRGWAKLESLAPGAISLPVNAVDTNVDQDRSACLGGREASPGAFISSARFIQNTVTSRYYLASQAGDYVVYGCAFKDGKKRLAKGVWAYTDPAFTLRRLRLF